MEVFIKICQEKPNPKKISDTLNEEASIFLIHDTEIYSSSEMLLFKAKFKYLYGLS
jgi:hypothetical protein